MCGLIRHIRQNGGKPDIDLFQDRAFADFRNTLDAEMKRLKQTGLGSQAKQAEPLTEAEEEILWEKGIIGDHSPQALLNAVFFLNSICFALRSGQEHRQLRLKDCQICVVQKHGEKAYLHYKEDCSKNNSGGLKSRKLKPKEVMHYENTDNRARCPVRLYKLYLSKCPQQSNGNGFYLKPLQNPHGDIWYSRVPLGHNTLDNMIKSMCKSAEITGYKTNHSLRATAATCLYHAGVDEQLIMERTGHRSLDRVRSYKRTSAKQQEYLSDILGLSNKKLRTADNTNNVSQQNCVAPAQIMLQSCSNITFNFLSHPEH